jgi:hypothetical protein
MVNALPISPGPPTGEIEFFGALPMTGARTFTYVPASGYDPRYLGPLVVGSDGSQMADFVAEAGTGIPAFMYRPASTDNPPERPGSA